MGNRILVVEDDNSIREMLTFALETEGFTVDNSKNGIEALNKNNEFKPDLVLLDLMLPDINGFEVCKKIQKERDIPVIMVTAKDDIVDKVLGLEIGADDYITKPFDPEVLILRINNILKRAYSSTNDEFKVSNTVLKYNTLELICGNTKEKLTLKEAQLLKYFIINKNKILAREDILTEIWGEDDYFLGRSMDVFISRLRKYVSEDTNIDIRTVRGTGFILEEVKKEG